MQTKSQGGCPLWSGGENLPRSWFDDNDRIPLFDGEEQQKTPVPALLRPNVTGAARVRQWFRSFSPPPIQDDFLTVVRVVLLQLDRRSFGYGIKLMRSCSVLVWLRQDGREPR
jgi:hypothetical protein